MPLKAKPKIAELVKHGTPSPNPAGKAAGEKVKKFAGSSSGAHKGNGEKGGPPYWSDGENPKK